MLTFSKHRRRTFSSPDIDSPSLLPPIPPTPLPSTLQPTPPNPHQQILLEVHADTALLGASGGGAGGRRTAGQSRLMAVQEALRLAFLAFKGRGEDAVSDMFRLYLHSCVPPPCIVL